MSPAKIIRKAGLVLVALGQFSFGDNAKSDLPDIVVYLSDDHPQFVCQLLGANDIPTPNLES